MKRIGKFEVIEVLGRGAMGVVYKARDPYLNRLVAIKVMTAHLELDPEIRTRFFREAQAAGSLQHPNITTVFELGESEGHPYIAMEFVPGRDLDDIIAAREPLTIVEKVDIIEQVCRGLSYAHDRGVIHRDVKPANIRITEMGQAKLMDFGVARLVSSELTSTGALIGTPYYMAPELIEGHSVDARADIFSVGATLYELLSYSRPFPGDSLQAVFHKILHGRPVPLRELGMDVAPLLQEILDRALAKDPSERYESMGELLTHLMTFWDTLPSAAKARASATHSIGATASRPRRRRRRRAQLVVVGVALGLAALGGGTIVLRGLSHDGAVGERAAVLEESAVGLPAEPAAAAGADTAGGQRIRAADETAGEQREEVQAPIRTPATEPAARDRTPPRPAEDPGRPVYLSLLARTDSARVAARAVDAARLAADVFQQGESQRVDAEVAARAGRYPEAQRGIEMARLRYDDARQQAISIWRARMDSARDATGDLRANADPASPDYRVGRAAEERAQAAERTGDFARALGILAEAAGAYQRSERAAAPAAEERAGEEAAAGESPPARPSNDEIVRSVLDELSRAIESRDVAALQRAWVGLTPQQVRDFESAFRAMRDIRVTFDVRSVTAQGDGLVVTVQTTYDFFNESSRARDRQSFSQELELGERDGRWVVVASRN